MSEKGELIISLEDSLNELKQILKNAKKSEFDDRMWIYIQGYAKSLEHVIQYLGYFFLKIKGDKK